MPDERALAALSRIERALARVESAASRPVPVPAVDGSAETAELDRLRNAHDRLRERVGGAIGQIDRMIETGQQS